MELEALKRKGKKVKLVVFDLDGTLLTTQGKISYHSKLAIDELKKKGIKIAIASGRIFTMLKSFYETLELKDFVISSNGASIDDLSTQQPVQQLFLDPEDAKKVIDFCIINHFECNIHKRDACYFQPFSLRLDRFKSYNEHAKEQNSEEIKLMVYEYGIDNYERIEKILIYETNSIKTKKIKHFVEMNTKLNHMSSNEGFLDISAIGVSKGSAVEKITEYMHIDLEQVCVFGDYDNDISMFNVAGLSIATSNGSKNAMKHADFITLSNDNEGIAYAVKELLL
ncbi:MAG: Cof-type HAD-IIB family hydrolase [Firmicutes bacterium]|nr:Cof-type HAD-IIB family hydrolase [Bacillota bacterium]